MTSDFFDDIYAALEDNTFEERPVDVKTFVEDEEYLAQPPLSEIQYAIVEYMSQIYREEDLIKLMGEEKGKEHYKHYTKNELILALGKGSHIATDEVYNPETGRWNTIASLMENTSVKVQGYGENSVVQDSTEAWCEGYSEVYRVELEKGVSVTVSPDHSFYDKSLNRVKLKKCVVGDRVALAAKTYCSAPQEIDDDEVLLLGWWLGDGMMPVDEPRRRIINMDFSSNDKEAQEKYLSILRSHGDNPNVIINPRGKAMTAVRSGIKQSPWALSISKKYGLWGTRANDKVIPDVVWNLSDRQIALFFGALWGTDGTVYCKNDGKKKSRWVLEYTTISEDLAVGIQRLLTRLGVLASLRSRITTYTYKGEKLNGQRAYYLTISDAEGFRRFAAQVKLFDKQHLLEQGIEQHKNVKPQSHYDGDLFFAKIKSVTKEVMPQPVFTMTAVDTHNFVANLVLNGNSGK